LFSIVRPAFGVSKHCELLIYFCAAVQKFKKKREQKKKKGDVIQHLSEVVASFLPSQQ
jgi:hypothetical protein